MSSPKLAAIYVRISKDRTGAGLGVDRQEQDCRKLAERLDMIVMDVFKDNDLSAYSGKPRPGYRKLLAAIEAGETEAVLVWHTDRLLRSMTELEAYIRACEPHDVTTHSVTSGPLDLSTPSGRMNARISAAVSVAEIDHMIERQRAARKQKAEHGVWAGNKRPFGYAANGVDLVEIEADALRWAAGQILSGMSLSATARELNRRGVLTSSGRAWDARTLGRVLIRARNAGLSVYKGQVVGRAQWPAILDETTWRGLVAVLSDPTRRTTPGGPPRWLLTNLGRCHCGGLVVSKTRARPKMAVYTCSAGAHLSRNAVEVDAYVRDVVVGVLVERGRDLLVPDGADEHLAELHLKDAALAAKLGELGRAYATDVIDFPTLETATALIRSEREAITTELTAMAKGSVLSGVADAPDVARAFDACDLSRRRAIVDLLMVVTLKRSRRGRRPGWRPGDSYFDPDSIEFTPK